MPPQLLANENVITERRQHPIVLAPAALAAVLIAIVVIVIGVIFPGTIASHAIGGIKALIVLIVLLIIAVLMLNRALQWRFATYTLTTRRIIVSRGVVSRVTESIALDRIQDTTVRKPLSDRMIHAGDIEIESAGREGTEILHRIPNPDGFYNELLQAIEDHRVGGVQAPSMAGAGAPPPPPPPPPANQGGL